MKSLPTPSSDATAHSQGASFVTQHPFARSGESCLVRGRPPTRAIPCRLGTEVPRATEERRLASTSATDPLARAPACRSTLGPSRDCSRSRTVAPLTFGELRRRTSPKTDPTPSGNPVGRRVPSFDLVKPPRAPGLCPADERTLRASVAPRRYRPRKRLVTKPLTPPVAHRPRLEFTNSGRLAKDPCLPTRANGRNCANPRRLPSASAESSVLLSTPEARGQARNPLPTPIHRPSLARGWLDSADVRRALHPSSHAAPDAAS